ncbi:MAG: hypothetical protein PHV17_05330, partial [Candidatus Omnitrophica bacterium]|nr:hypothetical protein [Candidatus Omnitrophota bacterium]
MQINDSLYFPLFLETILLYLVLFFIIFLFIRITKVKRPAGFSVIIFVAVIFLDLLFFSRQIIPQVTWERKNIPFNEGVNPFRFFN